MEDVSKLAAEVQEIVWALVDDQVTDEQIARLEQLVVRSDDARRTYVQCMQMHADLHYLLGKQDVKLPPLDDVPAMPPLPIVDLPLTGFTPIPGSS